MVIRIGLFATPFGAAGALVVLLNGVHAGAGTFGLVAVGTGAALGYFADRLPELRRDRHPHHFAGAHHGD